MRSSRIVHWLTSYKNFYMTSIIQGPVIHFRRPFERSRWDCPRIKLGCIGIKKNPGGISKKWNFSQNRHFFYLTNLAYYTHEYQNLQKSWYKPCADLVIVRLLQLNLMVIHVCSGKKLQQFRFLISLLSLLEGEMGEIWGSKSNFLSWNSKNNHISQKTNVCVLGYWFRWLDKFVSVRRYTNKGL